eukprot:COSAG02_NODE_70773_length_194_cov_16.978947_1_plen_56_part_01
MKATTENADRLFEENLAKVFEFMGGAPTHVWFITYTVRFMCVETYPRVLSHNSRWD